MPVSCPTSVYSASRPGTQRAVNVSEPSRNEPKRARAPVSRRTMNICTECGPSATSSPKVSVYFRVSSAQRSAPVKSPRMNARAWECPQKMNR